MDTMNMFKKDERMNTFTTDEQIILKNVSSKYKWIARDMNGALFVYARMPKKAGCFYSDDICDFRLEPFEHVFKKITWKGGPVQFRKDVLDKTERKYLKAVLRPFKKRIKYVMKRRSCPREFLIVRLYNGESLYFPGYKEGKMYREMELDKGYTLEELGINY